MKAKLAGRWLRSTALGGTLLVAAIAVSACGSSSSSSSGSSSSAASANTGSSNIRLVVNEYSREIPYFQQILKGIQTAANPLGWKVDASFANTNPTQQINQIQNAVTTHPNAMVVIPIDQNAIIPPITMAKNAGVPVLTMGDNLSPAGQSAQLAFLGVNYEAMGAQKAQYIANYLHGHGTVGVIHGIRGLNFSEAQNTGAQAVFKKYPGIKIVDGGYTGAFTSDTGLAKTENLLTAHPNVNAMYFDNDDIALGGIQAMQARGLSPKNVLTVGTDGGPAALAAVQQGKLDYTISLCGFAQGKTAVALLKNYLVNKVAPPKQNITPTLVFTPKNVAVNIQKVHSGEC